MSDVKNAKRANKKMPPEVQKKVCTDLVINIIFNSGRPNSTSQLIEIAKTYNLTDKSVVRNIARMHGLHPTKKVNKTFIYGTDEVANMAKKFKVVLNKGYASEPHAMLRRTILSARRSKEIAKSNGKVAV